LKKVRERSDAWNAESVLKILESLVEKSHVLSQIERERLSRQGGIATGMDSTDEVSAPPVLRKIGYFAMIGLLRLNCLLGDYYSALKAVNSVALNAKGQYTQVMGCHINLFYYVGSAYMMMRRYSDAIRTFSSVLVYINRARQYHTRSHHHEQMIKKSEHMYGLLAMCVTLSPQRIDENIHQNMREKLGDKLARLQRGDEECFKEIFMSACPKLVDPILPQINSSPNPSVFGKESVHQLGLFLNEVREQSTIATLRSYLKLYTTISIPKLAHFLEQDEETTRTNLMLIKHKARNLVWTGGPLLSGQISLSGSDLDFFVEKEMIHVVNSKVARRFGDYFTRHIMKFEEILHNFESETS